jgi:hypothetical protein
MARSSAVYTTKPQPVARQQHQDRHCHREERSDEAIRSSVAARLWIFLLCFTNLVNGKLNSKRSACRRQPPAFWTLWSPALGRGILVSAYRQSAGTAVIRAWMVAARKRM